MKKQEMDYLAEQICRAIQSNLRLDNPEVIDCDMEYESPEGDGSMLDGSDMERAKQFLDQKNRESFYSDKAFANLVTKIDLLEKAVENQNDAITDLKDSLKKQKGRVKEIESQVGVEVNQINRKINSIMNILKNLCFIANLLGEHVKKKNMERELKKYANKKRSRERKYLSIVQNDNCGQWTGGNKKWR